MKQVTVKITLLIDNFWEQVYDQTMAITVEVKVVIKIYITKKKNCDYLID